MFNVRKVIISGIAGLVVGAVIGATVLAPQSKAPSPAPSGRAGNSVTIGTGGVTGVYYPAGGAVCLLVNRERKNHGFRCSVESTRGSVFNLNKINSGDLDMGIAQSDWHFHAYNGTSRFKDQGPMENLRSVFSIHPEPFTVVARAASGIKAFGDLRGKRVNIGNPGSGQRGTMEVLMKAQGWTRDDFQAVSELRSRDQSSALCAGQIDAMVFTVGHPSRSIKEATTSCDSVIVEVSGPVIDKLVQDNEYYRTTVIPAGMYRGNPDDVRTFGVVATFVTSAATPADAVYTVVKAVFENFEAFKMLHPAFKILNKADMIKNGLSAPLHAGAVKYYKEAGLM